MLKDGADVSVVEALVIFLMSIVIMTILEITLGATFDQMAFAFSKVYIPGLSTRWLQTNANILGLFRQIHLIVGVLIIMTAIWVIRVVFFRTDWTREYRGGR